LECEYLPCSVWYNHALSAAEVVLEQYEYFERASLRNRCFIAGPNGVIPLTVPLEGGRNQKCLMKDIRISKDTEWQLLHWKTIVSCYNRSPYFFYFEDIWREYFSLTFSFLWDANIEALERIQQCSRKTIAFRESLGFEKDPVQHNYRTLITAKNYTTVEPVVSYQQVFQERLGFLPNLSILDKLFCTGSC
jgi:hypothetical protein